jgi:hypothetical protein
MAQANRPEGLAGGGRGAGGITGAGGRYVNPKYKEVGPSVKVIKAGTKSLTRPDVPFHAGAMRSPAELKRMGN